MSFDSIRLLIVDDCEDDAILILHEMKMRGCSVADWLRVDTRTALERALSDKEWDVVTSDHKMPFFSAPEALELVKKAKPDIPVIIVSGEIDISLAVSLLRQGARDFVPKTEISRLPYAITREISDSQEHLRVTDALHESEVRFKTLVENIPGIVYRCETNAPWRMLHMNQLVETITGYPLDRFTGEEHMGWGEVVYKDDIAALVEMVDLAVETHSQFDVEYRIVNTSGDLRWVHEIGKCVLDSHGTPAWVDGVIMDITDKKLAEESIRKSETRYRTLFECASDAIMIHDMDMKFLDANTLACDRLGYSRDEMLQMSVDDIVSPAFAGRAKQHLELVLALGNAVFETEHVRRDGNFIPVEISCRQIEFNNQPAILGIIRDITERKAIENALRESEARYRAVYDHMNEGLCSHEIVYNEDGKAVDYRVTDVNPMYESIVHILREDAIGKLASELYHTEEPPFLQVYTEVAETGQPTAFETHFMPMDRRFRISVFSPGIGRFVTIFSDITDLVNVRSGD